MFKIKGLPSFPPLSFHFFHDWCKMNKPNSKGIRNQDLDSPWIDPFYTLGTPPRSITDVLIPIYLPCRCRHWSEAHGPAAGRNELLKSWPWRSPVCRRRLCRGLCRWWRWLRWPWQGKQCNVTSVNLFLPQPARHRAGFSLPPGAVDSFYSKGALCRFGKKNSNSDFLINWIIFS